MRALLPLLLGCAPDLSPVASPAEAPRRQDREDAVWLGPNVGSEDLLQLFTAPEGWTRARQHTAVLQLLGLGIEVGAVKHHTCDGEAAGRVAASLVERVAAAGGAVRYLSMGEPYIGGEATLNGESCGYTIAESARKTARFMQYLRAPQSSGNRSHRSWVSKRRGSRL